VQHWFRNCDKAGDGSLDDQYFSQKVVATIAQIPARTSYEDIREWSSSHSPALQAYDNNKNRNAAH
jgi:hypothetical protein